MHALGVQVQRQGHQVDIAGAFPIAEQAALDAVRPGQYRQFRRRDRRAAVIVGVDADDERLAPFAAGYVLVLALGGPLLAANTGWLATLYRRTSLASRT